MRSHRFAAESDIPATLSLDRVLGPDEAEFWLTRIAPAVENDFMAD